MVECTFELNDKPMSELKCGLRSFPAFSGKGDVINKRSSACGKGFGAIPPGTYYIIDRESGGLLGPLYDLFRGRNEWFSLLANDGMIDDETFCDKVVRSGFRLHPKGPSGESQGCIVIEEAHRFRELRSLLKNSETSQIPGTKYKTYGRVIVK